MVRSAPERVRRGGRGIRGYLVIAAVTAFGLLVRPVGLTGATCALVLLASFATPDMRPKEVAALAITLSVAGVLIFSVLLGLPLGW
jgi:hypothetical protein